jgi:hypothetical protein
VFVKADCEPDCVLYWNVTGICDAILIEFGSFWLLVQLIPLPHKVPPELLIFKFAPLGIITTPWLINLIGDHKSRIIDTGDTSKSTVLFTFKIVVLSG